MYASITLAIRYVRTLNLKNSLVILQNFVDYAVCTIHLREDFFIIPPYLLGGLLIGLLMALGKHLVHAEPSLYANW